VRGAFGQYGGSFDQFDGPLNAQYDGTDAFSASVLKITSLVFQSDALSIPSGIFARCSWAIECRIFGAKDPDMYALSRVAFWVSGRRPIPLLLHHVAQPFGDEEMTATVIVVAGFPRERGECNVGIIPVVIVE
jgi:hypothetical protein